MISHNFRGKREKKKKEKEKKKKRERKKGEKRNFNSVVISGSNHKRLSFQCGHRPQRRVVKTLCDRNQTSVAEIPNAYSSITATAQQQWTRLNVWQTEK